MRLELTRPNGHYPLKVARLPIPPSLHYLFIKSNTRVVCAQNRTRTCTSLNTRTWNERVYHSATWAYTDLSVVDTNSNLRERKTRLELATLTLARLCYTNWAISAILICFVFSLFQRTIGVVSVLRVQRYCFFLNHQMFLMKKCIFMSFFWKVAVEMPLLAFLESIFWQ